MSSTLSHPGRRGPAFVVPLLLLLLIGVTYYQIHDRSTKRLGAYFSERYDVRASDALIREAIQAVGQKLSLEVAIDLENIDISLDDYHDLVREAEEKFGWCQQYRLIVLQAGVFPCFSCISKGRISMLPGQTFKIGQTCGDEKSRYGSSLPGQNLKFFREMEGNIFEVMVAEYLQLKLFQYSAERKLMIEQNRLRDAALLLPPGNKITR